VGQHGTVDQVAGEVVLAADIADGAKSAAASARVIVVPVAPKSKRRDAAGRQPRLRAQRGERGDGVGRHHRVGKQRAQAGRRVAGPVRGHRHTGPFDAAPGATQVAQRLDQQALGGVREPSAATMGTGSPNRSTKPVGPRRAT
jgi:hypothetical protein